MSDRKTEIHLHDDPVNAAISSDAFIQLSESNQKALIDSYTNSKSKEGGFFGTIFGNKKDIAAMNITFAICILLVIIGCISKTDAENYWDVIIPAITTGMGYLFGKSGN